MRQDNETLSHYLNYFKTHATNGTAFIITPDGSYGYSDETIAFIRYLTNNGYTLHYDWMAESQALLVRIHDRSFIQHASLNDIQKLFTYLSRSEKFSPGTVATAIESGILTALIERAMTFPPPSTQPSTTPSQANKNAKLNAIASFILSILFFIVALLIAVVYPATQHNAQQTWRHALKPTSSSEFPASPDQAIVISGTLITTIKTPQALTPPASPPFVSYRGEKFVSGIYCPGHGVRAPVGTMTPPCWIDSYSYQPPLLIRLESGEEIRVEQQGTLQPTVSGDPYPSMYRLAHEWMCDESGNAVDYPVSDKTYRYYGFSEGEVLSLLGSVVPTATGAIVMADTLCGSTPSACIDELGHRPSYALMAATVLNLLAGCGFFWLGMRLKKKTT